MNKVGNKSIVVERNTFKDSFLLILMGMLSFSPFGSTLFFQYLHFPLSMPELFFIPLLYLLKKHFLPLSIDKDSFILLLLLQFFLVVLAEILGFFPFYDVLASSRGYIYIYLFYCIYKKNNRLQGIDIIQISLGTLIGWALASMMNLNTALQGAEFGVSNGNLVAAGLFLCYTILYKRWDYLMIGLVFILIINFTSGLRRFTFVILLSFVLAYLISYLKTTRLLGKQTVFIVILVGLFLSALPLIEDQVKDISPILHTRIFERTRNMFEDDKSDIGDDVRKGNFELMEDNLVDLMITNGMITYNTNKMYPEAKEKSPGVYVDFPLYGLSRVFGLPVALIIVFVFLARGLRCFINYLKNTNVNSGIYAVMAAILFALLFVEGSNLSFPYATPFTGLCLGRITYYAKGVRNS